MPSQVLKCLEPSEPLAPVVLDSPHSGNVFPPDFDHALDPLTVRRGEDAFVEQLFGAAPEHGAVLLHALFPRSYLDLNRAVTDVDESLLERRWPGPLRPTVKSRLGIGLIARVEPNGAALYRRKLSVAEVRNRIDSCYWPYHAALRQSLERAHERFGAVWHVNCHSMPAASCVASPEGPGHVRPDFCIGDRDGTTCDREFRELVVESLRAMGYRVAVNDPYKGVELVARYSSPARRRCGLQIEINRALYMDERRIEKHCGFAPLKKSLTRLVATVCEFARERTACRERRRG